MTLSSRCGRRTAANLVASSNFNSVSAARLPATQRCAGGQVSTLHCREMSAELMFGNQVSGRIVRIPPSPCGLPVVEPPQMWAEPAAWVATAAARRFRNCASSASSAQNSEQKCCPAEVRQTSARLVGGRRNSRQVLSRLGLVGSPRLRER